MGQEKQRERASKFSLITGQDSYASKTAQNPETSRRILSLIPTLAGYMDREPPRPVFASSTISGKILWLFECDLNISNVITRFFFAATSSALYVSTGAGSAFTAVTQVNPLAGTPVAVKINNVMHFSDGVKAWIFDGVNWKVDGLPIPLHAPSAVAYPPGPASNITALSRVNGILTVTVPGGWANGASITIAGAPDPTMDGEYQTIPNSPNTGFALGFFQVNQVGLPDSSFPGGGGTAVYSSITVQVNRFYWYTFADQSVAEPHESSSSPRSVLGSGPVTNEIIRFQMRTGSMTTSNTSPNVVGSATDWGPDDVGMNLYIQGTLVGTIASVTDAQHLTLTANAPTNLSGYTFVIAPQRATHIHIYCSEAETSNVGFLLASIPVMGADQTFVQNGGLPATVLAGSYSDQSPFAGAPGSYINVDLERPIRNDPPEGTHIMETHKNRIFRRDEQLLNYFYYTAFEEVLAFGTGDAYESCPGFDENTISDLVDETSFPDQSIQILGMKSYADALFIGTERQILPMFGESINDFVLSDIVSFAVGLAGRRAIISTSYGLVFLSFDQKLYLWPSQWIPFYAPDETAQLIELSRPLRSNFQQILPSDMDNFHIIWYNWGQRNWIVNCYQDRSNQYHTWVFDFETKGWFELVGGISSIAVWEPTFGNRVLVGGTTAGQIVVLDDQTGSFSTAGMSYPQGLFRTVDIDFGAPDTEHVLKHLEYEVSNPALNITVNYYLDPLDPDNLGAPSGSLTMTELKIGSARFKGFWKGVPALCKRVIIEFIVASDTNAGFIYSISLAADPASGLAGGPKTTGD